MRSAGNVPTLWTDHRVPTGSGNGSLTLNFSSRLEIRLGFWIATLSGASAGYRLTYMYQYSVTIEEK